MGAHDDTPAPTMWRPVLAATVMKFAPPCIEMSPMAIVGEASFWVL